jgi:hypothetical protein
MKEKKRNIPKIRVKWPITIVTDQTLIKGETRIITDVGLFIRCEERLPNNDVYKMFVRPHNRRFVATKGKLIWSNFESKGIKNISSGTGFYFAKITDEDRHLLDDMIFDYLEIGRPKARNNKADSYHR